MKNYQKWMGVKANIHNGHRMRSIKEGEIWWCGVGDNVGVEINGKSNRYSRPVLIFKKFSALGFLAIPLTSQNHVSDWYVSFNFKGKKETAVLSQIRTMSTSRLYEKIGTADKTDMLKIRKGFRKLFLS